MFLGGCAETLYVADKLIGAGLGALAENQKRENYSKRLSDPHILNFKKAQTWIYFNQIGNGPITIRAFERKNDSKSKFIATTEYVLDFEEYLAMSEDQKRAHIRSYFKDRTGIDLDPSMEPTAESPKPEEKTYIRNDSDIDKDN